MTYRWWPFRRKPVVTWEEYLAGKPDAPCGDKSTHYHWVDFETFGCPKCAYDAKQRSKDAEINRMADAVASRVAELMRKP